MSTPPPVSHVTKPRAESAAEPPATSPAKKAPKPTPTPAAAAPAASDAKDDGAGGGADGKASKTKMLLELAQDVSSLRRLAEKTSSDFVAIKTWVRDVLKPSLNTLRAEFLGDVDGLKAIVATLQASWKNASQDLDAFRLTLQKESAEQVRFRQAIQERTAADLDLLSSSVDTRIKKEVDRVWQLVEGWKKDNVSPPLPMDMEDQLQLMETRLEQVVVREVRHNVERVDQDMRLLEERLEQLCFREVMRLREKLADEREADREQAASSKPGKAAAIVHDPNALTTKQQEVIAWLEGFGLASHAPKLFGMGYDSMFVVQYIIPEDLDALGITLPGHRKALLLAIETLRSPTAAAPSAAAVKQATYSATTGSIVHHTIASAATPQQSQQQPAPKAQQQPAPQPHAQPQPAAAVRASPPSARRTVVKMYDDDEDDEDDTSAVKSAPAPAMPAVPSVVDEEIDEDEEVTISKAASAVRPASGSFSKPPPPSRPTTKPPTPAKPALAAFNRAKAQADDAGDNGDDGDDGHDNLAPAAAKPVAAPKPDVPSKPMIAPKPAAPAAVPEPVAAVKEDDEDLIPLPVAEPEQDADDVGKPSAVEQEIDAELQKLVPELRRLAKHTADGHAVVLFEQVFRDAKIERLFDSVGGILKSAKAKGIISYEGSLLLEGKHNKVEIFLADSAAAPAKGSTSSAAKSRAVGGGLASGAGLPAPAKGSDAVDAIARVFAEDEAVSWVLLSFDKDTPVVHESGTGGADEVSTHLSDSMVLFGYLRTSLGAEQRTKYVYIRWVGSSITPGQRARAVEQTRIMAESYMKFYHIELLAHNQDECTTAIVNARLTKAAGANYDSKQNAVAVDPNDFAFGQTKTSAAQFFTEIEKQGNLKSTVYQTGPLSITPVDLTTRQMTVGATNLRANLTQ